MKRDAEAATAKPQGTCPVCKSPTVAGFRPFCSRRCADIDLGRWLTGSYAIAGGNADADEDGDQASTTGGEAPGEGQK